jgi:hypothetical protein
MYVKPVVDKLILSILGQTEEATRDIRQQLISDFGVDLYDDICRMKILLIEMDKAQRMLDERSMNVVLADLNTELTDVTLYVDAAARTEKDIFVQLWSDHHEILQLQHAELCDHLSMYGVDVAHIDRTHEPLQDATSRGSADNVDAEIRSAEEALTARDRLQQKNKPKKHDTNHTFVEDIVEAVNVAELQRLTTKAAKDIILEKYVGLPDVPIWAHPPSFTNILPSRVLKALYELR